MDESKQLRQVRLLGRCLTAMLLINLLVVGIAFWTKMGTASAEASQSSQTPPGAAESVVAAQPTDGLDKANPQTPVPATTPVPAPVAAIVPAPAIAEPTSTAPVADAPSTEAQTETTQETPALPAKAVPCLLRLANPSETGGVVYYAVDGESFSLNPGDYHELSPGKERRIEFHRGEDFGYANFELQAGDYLFSVGDAGWDLTPVKMELGSSLTRAH